MVLILLRGSHFELDVRNFDAHDCADVHGLKFFLYEFKLGHFVFPSCSLRIAIIGVALFVALARTASSRHVDRVFGPDVTSGCRASQCGHH